eukprot:gene17380-22928_t
MKYKCSVGQSDTFPNHPVVDGWEYTGEWEIEILDEQLSQSTGWTYAMSFEDINKGIFKHVQYDDNKNHYLVRRRRWIRNVVPTNPVTASMLMKVNQTSTIVNDSFDIDDDDSESADNNTITDGINAKFEFEDDTTDSTTVIESEDDSNFGRRSIYGVGPLTKASSITEQIPKTSNNQTILDKILRIKDPSLTAIGKQIREKELECSQIVESDAKDWNKYNKPALQIQINELEKYCNNIKYKIEHDLNEGVEYINNLEEELKIYSNRLEDVKKKFYFPDSAITFGQNGMYYGMDDFWLENYSGHFDIEIIPSKDLPIVKLLMKGTNVNEGFKIILKADGFKLAGDKGKRIPKLRMESLKVTVSLTASLIISYDIKSSTWISNPKDFKLELLSFKGPYGITKSMVGIMLSIISPTIRSKVVNSLPVELGLLARTLPSPFSMRGEFDITGPELSLLSTSFEKSASMDRTKFIRNMHDLLEYYRTYVKHNDAWNSLLSLWNQASRVYSEKISNLKVEMNPAIFDPTSNQISFNHFLTVAEDFRRKPLGAYFKLQHIDGQISLNHILKFTTQFLHRKATEASTKSVGAKQIRMQLMLDRIQANHEAGMKLIKFISKNVDFVQLKLKSSLVAGPDGKLHCSVRDVLAQLPLVINFNLHKQKNMGQKALVPFMISITPKDEGDINIEVYHYSEDLSVGRLNDIKSSNKLDFNNISKLAEQSFENIKKTVSTTISTGNHKPSISASINSNGINGFVNTKRGEKMNKALHETINDMPVGNKADTIVHITTSRPHISMIVDKQMTLKPGSEIFTFLLGPKEKDWKPFGTETTESSNDTTSEDSNINKEKGCPILIQTGPGIKMLAQIPNGE